MKVYIRPPAHMSLAMFRVANALRATMPAGVFEVKKEDDADLLVLHVIGPEAVDYRRDKRCAVIQYCLATGGGAATFRPLWQRATLVWSYYDLSNVIDGSYYRAPMGLSDIFAEPFAPQPRLVGSFTSGYVTGPGAEAIEEVVLATKQVGKTTLHLGPRPVGLKDWVRMNCTGLIPDERLRSYFHQTQYVSGLRHVEGFEMCALEGLACGARPIMFDRPCDRYWFGDHAHYVPENSGPELIAHLARLIAQDPVPVSPEERAHIINEFNWDKICNGFWKGAL